MSLFTDFFFLARMRTQGQHTGIVHYTVQLCKAWFIILDDEDSCGDTKG